MAKARMDGAPSADHGEPVDAEEFLTPSRLQQFASFGQSFIHALPGEGLPAGADLVDFAKEHGIEIPAELDVTAITLNSRASAGDPPSGANPQAKQLEASTKTCVDLYALHNDEVITTTVCLICRGKTRPCHVTVNGEQVI